MVNLSCVGHVVKVFFLTEPQHVRHKKKREKHTHDKTYNHIKEHIKPIFFLY